MLAKGTYFLPNLQPIGLKSSQTTDTALCSTTGHTLMGMYCNPVVLPTHNLPLDSL